MPSVHYRWQHPATEDVKSLQGVAGLGHIWGERDGVRYREGAGRKRPLFEIAILLICAKCLRRQ